MNLLEIIESMKGGQDENSIRKGVREPFWRVETKLLDKVQEKDSVTFIGGVKSTHILYPGFSIESTTKNVEYFVVAVKFIYNDYKIKGVSQPRDIPFADLDDCQVFCSCPHFHYYYLDADSGNGIFLKPDSKILSYIPPHGKADYSYSATEHKREAKNQKRELGCCKHLINFITYLFDNIDTSLESDSELPYLSESDGSHKVIDILDSYGKYVLPAYASKNPADRRAYYRQRNIHTSNKMLQNINIQKQRQNQVKRMLDIQTAKVQDSLSKAKEDNNKEKVKELRTKLKDLEANKVAVNAEIRVLNSQEQEFNKENKFRVAKERNQLRIDREKAKQEKQLALAKILAKKSAPKKIEPPSTSDSGDVFASPENIAGYIQKISDDRDWWNFHKENPKAQGEINRLTKEIKKWSKERVKLIKDLKKKKEERSFNRKVKTLTSDIRNNIISKEEEISKSTQLAQFGSTLDSNDLIRDKQDEIRDIIEEVPLKKDAQNIIVSNENKLFTLVNDIISGHVELNKLAYENFDSYVTRIDNVIKNKLSLEEMKIFRAKVNDLRDMLKNINQTQKRAESIKSLEDKLKNYIKNIDRRYGDKVGKKSTTGIDFDEKEINKLLNTYKTFKDIKTKEVNDKKKELNKYLNKDSKTEFKAKLDKEEQDYIDSLKQYNRGEVSKNFTAPVDKNKALRSLYSLINNHKLKSDKLIDTFNDKFANLDKYADIVKKIYEDLKNGSKLSQETQDIINSTIYKYRAKKQPSEKKAIKNNKMTKDNVIKNANNALVKNKEVSSDKSNRDAEKDNQLANKADEKKSRAKKDANDKSHTKVDDKKLKVMTAKTTDDKDSEEKFDVDGEDVSFIKQHGGIKTFLKVRSNTEHALKNMMSRIYKNLVPKSDRDEDLEFDEEVLKDLEPIIRKTTHNILDLDMKEAPEQYGELWAILDENKDLKNKLLDALSNYSYKPTKFFEKNIDEEIEKYLSPLSEEE